MLLNPKGGSGKTTIATSLAAFYARRDLPTILFDHDAQGSSTRWLGVRPKVAPSIEGVAAFRAPAGMTRSWQMRVPAGIERAVIDTPAGTRSQELRELIRHTDSIVMPVLPSHIDIDAVSAFAVELAAMEPVRSGRVRVAVVANRVRENSLIFRELQRFLETLSFPFVATLRESLLYLRSAERGLGIHELHRGHTRIDRRQWSTLIDWLEGERALDTECDVKPARIPTNYALPM